MINIKIKEKAVNKEEKIFEIYLHLIKANPTWLGSKAAREAVEMYTSLENAIADDERIKEIRKTINEKQAVWDILNLTVRTGNCLRAEEIYTLDELCQSSERRLLSIPNLGRRSFREIKEALAKIGRTIGEKR